MHLTVILKMDMLSRNYTIICNMFFDKSIHKMETQTSQKDIFKSQAAG